MTIGQMIRKERKREGLTQQEAAEKAGVSVMTIRRVEKNFQNPSFKMIKQVADSFGVSTACLFEQDDTDNTSESMTMNEYQQAAARTINPALYPEQQLRHALHGMAGEVGEIHSLFQKSYQGHPLDHEHLKKEFGDLLWMLAEGCTAMNWTLEQVARENIEKLKARYPDGFDAEKSMHRKEGDI